MPTVSLGMIGATLFGQTTVICAGFFTNLPVAVGWIRFISPIFYTFKGIVKSTYSWDDTYKCDKGQSMFGPNECLLEESAAIDDYKQRKINVATFGDPKSGQIGVEVIMLFILFGACQLFMLLYHIMMQCRNTNTVAPSTTTSQMHLDDQYDEKIADFSRQSIFLKVDGATLRQTFRDHLSEGNSQITAPDESNRSREHNIRQTFREAPSERNYHITFPEESHRSREHTLRHTFREAPSEVSSQITFPGESHRSHDHRPKMMTQKSILKMLNFTSS